MAGMDSRLARLEVAEHARLDAELDALLRSLSDAELETLSGVRLADMAALSAEELACIRRMAGGGSLDEKRRLSAELREFIRARPGEGRRDGEH
jgi:hypothetical protein